MFNASSAEGAPQPPKVLSTPLEIAATLRVLQQGNAPLILTFKDRRQRYQTYLVHVDSENQALVLDEIIPRDGERLLLNGEAFSIEGMPDGVLITWESAGPWVIDESNGVRSYRGPMPDKVIQHQRRNAFRATLETLQRVDVELGGVKLKAPLSGKMLDISATGCKLRFLGDICALLEPGQVYEKFSAVLPFGKVDAPVELRYVHFEERTGTTFAGVHFHRISGLAQRHVERFVYQLQREARRSEKDDERWA